MLLRRRCLAMAAVLCALACALGQRGAERPANLALLPDAGVLATMPRTGDGTQGQEEHRAAAAAADYSAQLAGSASVAKCAADGTAKPPRPDADDGGGAEVAAQAARTEDPLGGELHPGPSPAASGPAAPPPGASAAPEQHRRDTRALKERFNYASADCAAVVLKANREARGMTAILNSKKDQYMLNECAARSKFVVVELCDDILIDTLVLGNYEFFSSTFKDVMVYVTDRYPPKDNQWTLLGRFQGFNSRDAQVFPVADPKIWARYVMVEFVTHHGHEFYCPLTVFKVYGATQMEQYRKEAEEDEDEYEDAAGLDVDGLLGAPLLDHRQFRIPLRQRQHLGQGQDQEPQPLRIAGSVSPAKAYLKDMRGLVREYRDCDRDEPASTTRSMAIPRVPSLPWAQGGEAASADGGDAGSDQDGYEDDYDGDDDDDDDDDNNDGSASVDTTAGAEDDATAPQSAADAQLEAQGLADPHGRPADTGGVDKERGGSGPRPAVAGGHRQESIFKTIMRRLARVERNVTLAYRYLEEQHLVFNMVLQQVEINSLETMRLAIDQLNRTTAKQMQSLTTLSEEVWRAILYDLEEYQQKTESEMGELGSKLEFLAGEVLFEKRMNVAQLVLLLTIVVMVAVNKAATKLALIPEAKKEK